MDPSHRRGALALLVALLIPCAALGAFENEQLSLGMDEYQINCVFSAYHGCGDTFIVPGPDTLSWRAFILGRRATVTIGMSSGLVSSLDFAYQTKGEADAAELLASLERFQADRYGAPIGRDGDLRIWAGPRLRSTIAIERGADSIVLRVRTYRPSGSP